MPLTANADWKNDSVDADAAAVEGQAVEVVGDDGAGNADAVLGTVVVPAGHFAAGGATVEGEASATGPLTIPITTDGTADRLRIYRTATGYLEGTVGVTGSGADFEAPRVALVAGDEFRPTLTIVFQNPA